MYFMEQSLFLAQILWPVLIVVWISLIFNEKFFKKMIKDMANENSMLYIGWILSLLFGLYVMLSVENGGYLFQSILLIFGLLATFKWVLLLIFPKYMKKVTKDAKIMIPFLKYFGVTYVVLGIYLCYAGY